MALDLIAELETLVEALTRENLDYAVCGGLALAMPAQRGSTSRQGK